MLIIADLADTMKLATQGKTNPAEAMTALGMSISNYILANAVLTFSWIASNTVYPYEPDPIIVATGGFLSVTIILTPGGETNHSAAKLTFETQIMNGMKTATYNITQITVPPFATVAGISSDIGAVTLNVTGLTARDAAFLQMATDIITWLKAYIPAMTCAGTRGTYSGIGTVTNIS